MFCKFCGKELQDGEVCGCAGSQQAAAAQAQQTSGAAQAATDQISGQVNAGQADAAGAQGTQFNTAQMQQKANEYMQQGMEAAGNAWKNLLGIFKSPAQEGRAYVAESDMTVSLILIVLQAVIAGLFGLICTTRINAAFSGITSYFSSNKYQVSNAKGFFVTLIFSVVLSAVFALIFFAAGKIVKADIDYKKAFAITSVRSAAVIPFMLAGCVLLFVNPGIAFAVFYLGNILAICFVYAAMTGICEENKLSYMIAVSVIVFAVVAVVIMSKAVGLYVPSGIKSLSSLSSLMSMFY